MIFKLQKVNTALLAAVVLMLAGTATAFAGTLLGDSDGNGRVNIIDVTCIQKHAAELPAEEGFSESAADIDGNGKIDIKDATLIQKWIAKMETPYLIGEQIQAPTEEQTTQKPTQRPTDADGWGRDIFRP